MSGEISGLTTHVNHLHARARTQICIKKKKVPLIWVTLYEGQNVNPHALRPTEQQVAVQQSRAWQGQGGIRVIPGGLCVCVGVWRERSPGTERSFSSAERLYLLEWGPGPAGCPTGTQYPRCSQPRLLPPACAPVRRQNTEWQQYLAIFQSTYPQSYHTSPSNHNPVLKVLKCIIDPSDWSLE